MSKLGKDNKKKKKLRPVSLINIDVNGTQQCIQGWYIIAKWDLVSECKASTAFKIQSQNDWGKVGKPDPEKCGQEQQ